MDLRTPTTDGDHRLDAVERALALGQFEECKALLAKCSEPSSPRQRQLRMSLVLLTSTSDGDLWKVFELSRETASAEDVRRRFRTLAKLVHPDRTGTGATAHAFEALCRGAEVLVAQLQARPGALEPADTGYNWWDAWDDDERWPQSRPGAAPAEPGASQEDLRGATEEWLRAEISRRQRELLAPTRDANGSLIPLAQLKQRLESVKQELQRRNSSEAPWNGGFLPT